MILVANRHRATSEKDLTGDISSEVVKLVSEVLKFIPDDHSLYREITDEWKIRFGTESREATIICAGKFLRGK